MKKSIIKNQSQNSIISRYNNLKMSILDKTKIGNLVQVNLTLSRDRLNKEIINALEISSVGKISDFRITDGKGIGLSCNYLMEKNNGLKMR